MNELQLGEVWDVLGGHGVSQVENLREFLGYPEVTSARLAPSVVTRSECEMFGMSIPRFAFRISFRNKSGFVNLRRISELVSNAQLYGQSLWGTRDPSGIGDFAGFTVDEVTPVPEVGSLLTEDDQSCIADCLLEVPEWVKKEHYRVLTAQLLKAYGEAHSASHIPEDVGLSPYVKSINLGGGLCSQAIAFMVSALMNHYSSAVHGFVEVTALAHRGDLTAISLGGLRIDNLVHYFDHIDLRGIQQLPRFHSVSRSVEDNPSKIGLADRMDVELESAVRAYLRSNIPIIVPTDTGKLMGFEAGNDYQEDKFEWSVYGVNGLEKKSVLQEWRKKGYGRQPHGHVLLLIGYSYGSGEGKSNFVFHDPAAMPFMKLTLQQLGSIGSYSTSDMRESDNRLILPITPKAVTVPLLWWRRRQKDPFQPGLMWLAHQAREFSNEVTDRLPPSCKPGLGRFQLTPLGQTRWIQSITAGPSQVRTEFKQAVQKNIDKLVLQFAKGENHWVWVESRDDSLWLWDAEMDPPSTEAGRVDAEFTRRYVGAEFHITAGGNMVEAWIPKRA